MGGSAENTLAALAANASDEERAMQYGLVSERLELLLEGEQDWVAAMATVACELHHAFECELYYIYICIIYFIFLC